MFNLSFFKTCVKCNEEKLISAFYANPNTRDQLDSFCKECRKENSRRWRAENREWHRKYSREHQRKNKTVRQAYYKEWRKQNLQALSEYSKEWRQKNPERTLAQRKVENARRRARVENAEGKYTAQEWMELKEKYSNRCLACGRCEPEVKITPDHVVPLALGGSNSIDNIQPLCWGCNAAKQARIVDYRCQT